MTSAIAPMKPTPMHPGGPAGAGDPGLVAAAEREADPHRRRLAEAERDHEGQRRDLQRDGVGGDRRGADPAHEISGEREHAHFERHGHADRPAEPRPSPSSAGRRTATSGRTGGSGGTAGRSAITATSAPQMISQVSVLPSPPPTRPSAGKPEMAEDQRPAEQRVDARCRRGSATARPAAARAPTTKLRSSWNSSHGAAHHM